MQPNPTLDPNKNQPQISPDDTKAKHTVVIDNDTLSHSGKNVDLVNPPIVTVHESSGKKAKTWTDNTKSINNINDILLGEWFGDLVIDTRKVEVGAGMFIPIEQNQTIDQLMYKVEAQVYRMNEYYSVPAHNAEGEEILDQVSIKEFKRNDDKTIQLTGNDVPITGASFTHLLRRIQIRQYVAKAVMKDDKNFDSDGVLIARVF